MTITRKKQTAQGKDILLELPEDWGQEIALTDWESKEEFIQAIFTALMNEFPDYCEYVMLAIVSHNHNDCRILLNEKITNPHEEKLNHTNLFIITIKNPLQYRGSVSLLEEKIAAPSSITPIFLSGNDRMILQELKLEEAWLTHWKEEANRMLIFQPKYFEELQKNIQNSIGRFKKIGAKIPPTSKYYPKLEKMIAAIVKNNAGTQIAIQCQKDKLGTLKLRLDNVMHAAYQEYVKMKNKLFSFRRTLWHILRDTANQYHKTLSFSATNITYFNNLFQGIAHIGSNNEFKLLPMDAENLSCKNIEAIFNTLLSTFNTRYNYWLAPTLGAYEPLITLQQKIHECLLPKDIFVYNNKALVFTISEKGLQYEKELIECMQNIRNKFVSYYEKILNEAHQTSYDILCDGKEQLHQCLKNTFRLAFYIQKKNEPPKSIQHSPPPTPSPSLRIEVFNENRVELKNSRPSKGI